MPIPALSQKRYELPSNDGAAMLPMNELEYTGIVERLGELENQFKIRKKPEDTAEAA